MTAPGPSRELAVYGLTAQWSNSFHHAVHAVITANAGHYREFALSRLLEDLDQGILHDGTWCSFQGELMGGQWTCAASRVPFSSVTCRTTDNRQSARSATDLRRLPAELLRSAPADPDRALHPMLFNGGGMGPIRHGSTSLIRRP